MPLYPNLTGTYARRREVDPRDYGVVMDCATDAPTLTANTTAFQAFITDIVTNGLEGEMPAGEVRVNSAINFPRRPGWSLAGAGRTTTIIKQYTDNVAVLNLGSDTASFMHTWSLRDFTLTYNNSQPAANTAAIPLLFSEMAYKGELRNVSFARGSYAIKVATGIGCPWGTSFDDLVFETGLTLGAMDWAGGINATPNNHFGRFTIHCDNMTGTAMRVRGYNFTIDTLEYLSATGIQLLELAAGGQVEIGTMKLEIGTYAAAGTLFNFLGSSHAKIGHVTVGGATMVVTPASGTLAVLGIGSGGGEGNLEVGNVNVTASSQSGNTVLFSGSSPSRIRVGKITVMSGGWQLTNNASATTSEVVTVDDWNNGRLSADKGDANYTVALSDPNIVHFQTALTAARTITLPTTGNLLFNGLTYEFIVDGAINGTNYLLVVANAATLRTQTRDKVRLRCTWRRHTTPSSGWVVTATDLTEALPAPPVAAGKAASYYIAWGGATGTRSLTDGQEVAVPLFWAGTAVDRIGIEVTTLAASTNIRLGIRHSLGGYPDALILDAGTIDASTTGVKEITISQALPKGAYYLTCTAQGGAPSIRSSAAGGGLGPFLPNSTAAGLMTANATGYARNGISGALPATFASPVLEGGNGPRLFVRGA